MERMGFQRHCFSGRVVTNDYSLLELYSEASIAMARKNFEGVLWRIELLRGKLDMTAPENQQAVGCFEIVCRYRKQMMEAAEAFRQIEALLRLTYCENNERVPFEGEALLFNQMGNLYVAMGQCDEAIALYKSVLMRYENSHIPQKYHFRTMYLLMNNMSRLMEHKKYAEADNWSKKALQGHLTNGMGNAVHVLSMTSMIQL